MRILRILRKRSTVSIAIISSNFYFAVDSYKVEKDIKVIHNAQAHSRTTSVNRWIIKLKENCIAAKANKKIGRILT